MFGTPGAGAQMVFGDLEHQIGFAFLTNKMYSGLEQESPQFVPMFEATYDIVKNFK